MEPSRTHAIGVTLPGRQAPAPGQAAAGPRGALHGLEVPLLVALITVVGAVLRVLTATQPLFGDELSTHWVVSAHGFFEVVSVVHADWEITPPLYFLLAWLTTIPGVSAELLRLPSLVAGIGVIPLVYLLGTRTVGRPAALVACALTALSPFMIFYSGEARSYQLMIVLLVLSTIALLAAVQDGRARWWIVYGACSCAAMYAHYTAAFWLAAQLLWVLWAIPRARKAALLANLGALVAYLPWLSGIRNDISSPTTEILSELSPFTFRAVRLSLQHWSIGHPFVYEGTGLRDLPGDVALVMLAVGVLIAVVGLLRAAVGAAESLRSMLPDPHLTLIVLLTLAVPVSEAVASAVGDNLFGTRNLAASWPAFALVLGALLAAAGPRLRFAAIALVVGAFAIGAAKMVDDEFHRPDSAAAAEFIDTEARPGDVVLDGAVRGVTPGPLSPLDAELERSRGVFRVLAPQQRRRPFTHRDIILPADETVRRAIERANGGRLFVLVVDVPLAFSPVLQAVASELPPGYRRVGARAVPGIVNLKVHVYARDDPVP
jgi:hypothetical protein